MWYFVLDMKILKASDTYVDHYTLRTFFMDKDINPGDRFGVSWKRGKRRKLRTYKLVEFGSRYCDSCGHYTYVTVGKGDKTVSFDNHLSPKSTFSMSDLAEERVGQLSSDKICCL